MNLGQPDVEKLCQSNGNIRPIEGRTLPKTDMKQPDAKKLCKLNGNSRSFMRRGLPKCSEIDEEV